MKYKTKPIEPKEPQNRLLIKKCWWYLLSGFTSGSMNTF